MSDLGQLLKKARLDKGMSLEQLEEITKIRKRYLEAIEEGDYKILPGSFYVRAFIKSYAEAVGMDPNEVLGLYRSVIPTPTVETTVEPIRRKKHHTRNTDKISKWASTIVMISFVMLVLGLIYYFIWNSYEGEANQQVDQSDKITTKSTPPEQQKQADGGTQGMASGTGAEAADKPQQPQQQPVQEQPKNTVLTLAKTENNTDYYIAENADKLNVQLKVNGEECWLRIDKIVQASPDKKPERQVMEQKLYKKGDTRDWVSDTSVYMTVGLPMAAEITVNGTKLNFENMKNPKNIQIDLGKTL